MKRFLILFVLLPSLACAQTQTAKPQFMPPNGLPLSTPLGTARNADGSGVTTFATMQAGIDAVSKANDALGRTFKNIALTQDGILTARLPDKESVIALPFSRLASIVFGPPTVGLYRPEIDQTLSGKFLLIGGEGSEDAARESPIVFSEQQGDYVLACYGDDNARIAVTAPVLTTAAGSSVRNGITRKQITFVLKAGDSLRLTAQWVRPGDVVYIARLQTAPS
ncbi:hypothetical protein [Asaia astilbis]|uniref:hypothetical protein n=1 Tax=Asaia astilbis TaxID=610244 RepID=UPI00046EC02C|nr:hypothetical protein [Asaia astilbis]